MTRKNGTISAEAAENQLNVLIERRAREAQDANYHARVWAESVQSYDLAAARERRLAWLRFHERQALTHRRIAEEHEQAITALTSGA